MPKRRSLIPGQQVHIVYHSKVGFLEQSAKFIEYRPLPIGAVQHPTPIFVSEGKEITGLECFWVLPEEINLLSLQRLQYDIIRVQIRALELGSNLENKMPLKVNDPALRIVQPKFTFDTRDQTWLEDDLAETDVERNWFRFERESSVTFYHLVYKNDWDNLIRLFNEQFRMSVTVDEAMKLSRKRMRYVMGSTAIRLAGNPDHNEWKRLAKEFEQTHRQVEERMNDWSEEHKANFPTIKTKKSLPFNPGPYFNECLERIPAYFEDLDMKSIRVGSVLRVVSYDPVQRYARVDFPKEIRELIKPESTEKPWVSTGADYFIYVTKDDLRDGFEFLGGSKL